MSCLTLRLMAARILNSVKASLMYQIVRKFTYNKASRLRKSYWFDAKQFYADLMNLETSGLRQNKQEDLLYRRIRRYWKCPPPPSAPSFRDTLTALLNSEVWRQYRLDHVTIVGMQSTLVPRILYAMKRIWMVASRAVSTLKSFGSAVCASTKTSCTVKFLCQHFHPLTFACWCPLFVLGDPCSLLQEILFCI